MGAEPLALPAFAWRAACGRLCRLGQGCYRRAMQTQADLFGTRPAPASGVPDAEIVEAVRARLHATLALVKAAEAMPWGGLLDVIREDNAFRFGKDLLPAAEGASLWAEFDREMDRLYAVMNAGKEFDPLD